MFRTTPNRSPLQEGPDGKPLRHAPGELFDSCLVVEDDSIIRLDLEETPRGFGLRMVHGASTLEAAMRIVQGADLRCAVLDHVLARGNSVAVAQTLVARGIPAVFLSGHGPEIELPAALSHLRVIAQPFSSAAQAEALIAAFESGSRRTGVRPSQLTG